MITKSFINNGMLRAAVAVVLVVSSITVAYAIELSKRPKTIVIDNLDTSTFSKGNPAVAAVATEVCGECHSIDYLTTQPKLSCAVWAQEIVKMGNTFGAAEEWKEHLVTYPMLNSVLVYLADNYGQGSASCDLEAVKAVPGLSN